MTASVTVPVSSALARLVCTQSDDCSIRYIGEVMVIGKTFVAKQRIVVLTEKNVVVVKKGFFGGLEVRKRIGLDGIVGVVMDYSVDELVLRTIGREYRLQGATLESFTSVLLRLKPALDLWTLCANQQYHPAGNSLPQLKQICVNNLAPSWCGLVS